MSETTANASLISRDSTSAAFQPTFFSRVSIAPAGAVVNHSGPGVAADPTMRAIGFQRAPPPPRPPPHHCRRPVVDRRRVAGGDRPLLLKRRAQAGQFLDVAAFRLLSSLTTLGGPLRDATSTGTTAPRNPFAKYCREYCQPQF